LTPILALAAAIPAAGAAEARIVAVLGSGSAPYSPAYVAIEFSVLSRAPDYAEAQESNLSAVAAALAVVAEEFKVAPADIATLSYRLSEEIEYEDGKQRRVGYAAETRMSVKLRDMAAYRAFVTALLDAGVNAVDSISFGADGLEALREKALVAAYADAERKAKAIAAASGAKLGPMLQFREASGGEPVVAPRAKAFAASAGGGEVLAGGERLVEAEAYVEFSLK